MSREPSWRAVAEVLAKRVWNYAQCNQHPESDPNAGCPFCEDRAAYRLWERKSGKTFKKPEIPGETVNVFDLMRAANQHDTSEG